MTWQRRYIDGRMQTVYIAPPAALPVFMFDQQRQQCEACALFSTETSFADRSAVTLCHCGLQGRLACSTSRQPGGPCGPDASRFQPKTAELG